MPAGGKLCEAPNLCLCGLIWCFRTRGTSPKMRRLQTFMAPNLRCLRVPHSCCNSWISWWCLFRNRFLLQTEDSLIQICLEGCTLPGSWIRWNEVTSKPHSNVQVRLCEGVGCGKCYSKLLVEVPFQNQKDWKISFLTFWCFVNTSLSNLESPNTKSR